MNREQKRLAESKIIKRSVLLAGHRTSVTLEAAFWAELQSCATRRGLSLNRLISQIDAARHGNLASALRLYILDDLNKNSVADLAE